MSGVKGMDASPKFTKSELEDVLLRVAKLDRRGWGQAEIAREIGVCQPTVSTYLRKIRDRFKEAQKDERGELTQILMEQYREIATEAWKAWERSKEDMRRVVEEEGLRMPPHSLEDRAEELEKIRKGKAGRNQRGKVKEGKGTPGEKDKPQMLKIRIQTTTEGRLPSSEYLRIVQSCLEAIRQLQGLDAPKKLDVRQQVLDWNKVAEELNNMEEMTVEQKLEKMLLETKQDPNGDVKMVGKGEMVADADEVKNNVPNLGYNGDIRTSGTHKEGDVT